MEPKFLIFYTLILLERKVYSVSIEDCPNGMINVTEYDDISLTCGQYGNEIQWYHTSGNYIGQCIQTRCTSTQGNEFTIQAEKSWPNSWSYKSTLRIRSVTRESARFIYCKDIYPADSRDTCTLRVTGAPDEVVLQNCRVWISDWQVQGECLVERMYASDDVYKCTWSVNNVQITGVFQRPLSSNLSDGRIYKSGVCSFRQQKPFNGYSFPNIISFTYKISIDPGPQNIRVTTISIVPPKEPETNCSKTVFEGSTVICICTSQNEENPPAKLVWDGLNTDKLLLSNVSRQQNSTNYTCRQTWGPDGIINTTVNYILTVAYGPSDVNISIMISENGAKTFVCTAMGVFPAARFYWNISCDEKTDTMTTSTCTLPARDTDDDIVVQCTARNTAFPTSSVTEIFVGDHPSTQTDIYSSGTEQSITQDIQQNMLSKGSSSSDRNNGGLIGGVVAAVLVAIIVGAVIVVFVVKRRKEEFNSERFTLRLCPRAFKFFRKKTPLSTPYATVTKPSSATPIKRLAAPSGDLYTATNTISVDYATVSDTIGNTVDVINRDCTPMASQSVYEMTNLKEAVMPTIDPKPTTVKTKNFQDTTGSVYMNVTEVPTDSGLGVYHIVPWRAMADTRNDSAPPAAAVSEDEYNALNFEEDRSGQEDQAATYHHLQHE